MSIMEWFVSLFDMFSFMPRSSAFNSSLCNRNLSFPIDTADTNPNSHSRSIHQGACQPFPKTSKRMFTHEREV